MKKLSTVLATVVFCLLAVCPTALGTVISESDVNDAMLRGYTAIKANDLDSAKVTFAEIVRDGADSPRAPEAMMILGSLEFKTDRAAGMKIYKALAETYPDTLPAATVLYRMGSEYTRTKHLSDAQEAFVAASENKSISELERGRSMLQVGFVDLAKYFSTSFWDRAEDGTPVLVKPKEAGGRDQYLESALSHFEETRQAFASGRKPGIAAVADIATGEIYLLSAKPELAGAAYLRVVDANGSVPEKLKTIAQYGLGQAFYGQGDLESALPQFEEAAGKFVPGDQYGFGVANKKEEGDIQSWRVLTLYGLKRFDAALIAAQEARAKFEKDPELKEYGAVMDLWEGFILYQTGKKSEGLDVLRDIVSQHQGTPYAIRAGNLISQFEEGDK